MANDVFSALAHRLRREIAARMIDGRNHRLAARPETLASD
jgi:hypothetical protein